jgi:glycosyltransferase involved in cell wall biosynthesis
VNILVVDSAPPCDLQQGNSLIGWHLFRRLRHHELTLVSLAPRDRLPDYHDTLAGMFHRVHLVPRDEPVAMLTSLVEPYLARIGGLPAGLAASVRAFRAEVTRQVSCNRFDVIHTRQLSSSWATAGLNHGAKLLELIDSETLQAWRRARVGSPRSMLKELAARILEARMVRRFAACTAVSEVDAAVVRRLAKGVTVEAIPNGVDAQYFAPLDAPETPRTVVFAGTMRFQPNVTAVLHFYRRILPLIRREVPDVRVTVVGGDPKPEILALRADPAVTVTGRVDDVRPWLAAAPVVICPVITGSGIKNKVLEALAMGRSVVTTTLGAESIGVRDGRELRIADEPGAFARAVVDLFGDPGARWRLGAAGRALVLDRYTWDACAARYDALYERLRREAHARIRTERRRGDRRPNAEDRVPHLAFSKADRDVHSL